MELSSLKNEIYDPVRKKWVEKTPEEEIRQFLVKKMVEKLGFPLFHLAIEKELISLPHLQTSSFKEIPKRRADIIVFAKDIHPDFDLFPLLMIECKAVKLTEKFAQQVIGYNAYVQAPFVALANDKEILTGAFDSMENGFRFVKGLPDYGSLLATLGTSVAPSTKLAN